MKFLISKKANLKVEAVIVPICDNLKLKLSENEGLSGMIKDYLDGKFFEGKMGEVYSISRPLVQDEKHIILVGFGDSKKIDSQGAFEAIAKAVQKAQSLKAKSIRINVDNVDEGMSDHILSRIIVGAGLGEYKYDVFKTQESKVIDVDALEIVTKSKNGKKVLDEAKLIVESTCIARNLVNMPANILKPKKLSELAVEYGKEYGFDVEVIDKARIKKLKMEAFLAVSQGSDAEPKLIVMRYNGGGDKESVGLVGKGLTYDSGGYSLKPSDSMKGMKTDMAGSAAVIGAMCAISKNKLPANIVGVVAACENMVSGGAILPGDIINSMCGKTIEVDNTDAEGRLTLIDAVHYAVTKEKCAKVVDLATLTGAVVIALGDQYAGMIGNDDDMLNAMSLASEKSGDSIWKLPYTQEVAKRNKSKIADLINSPKRGLSPSAAGAFVGEGVNGKPWIHLDIAGVADFNDDRAYCRNGGSGYGVNLIYQFIKAMK